MTAFPILTNDTIRRLPLTSASDSVVDFVMAQMYPTGTEPRGFNIDAPALRQRYESAEAVFRNVPHISAERVAFPPIARIILNMRCRYNCGVQNLCHREGLPDDVANRDLSVFDIATLATVRQALGLTTAKLIGLETTPIPRFCDFVNRVKRIGFSSTTVTCALGIASRSLPSLVVAGIDRMTCSVHQFDDEVEHALNALLAQANRHALPVKLNWVLRPENICGLSQLIQYISENHLTARLFCPISPAHVGSGGRDYPLHWTDVSDLFARDIVSVRVTDYTVSCRRKYLATLRSGAALDLSVPLVAIRDAGSIPPVCAACHWKDRCEEGLLGCGVRLGPDGSYYSCLLRPDLRAI